MRGGAGAPDSAGWMGQQERGGASSWPWWPMQCKIHSAALAGLGNCSIHPSSLSALWLHPEAQVWIIFVVSCSFCGHQIVLLNVTPKAPFPHHKLGTKPGVPFKNGSSEWGAHWGKMKYEIWDAKSLSRSAVYVSPLLLSSLQVTTSPQGHNCSPCQASKKTFILCRAFQLYMLSCSGILSLLLLKPYILMQKVIKSWGTRFDWRMIVASYWRTL